MRRDDWEAVYLNQDRILQGLKSLEEEIFLAGGTGLHRFVLPNMYRHSHIINIQGDSYRLKEKKESGIINSDLYKFGDKYSTKSVENQVVV